MGAAPARLMAGVDYPVQAVDSGDPLRVTNTPHLYPRDCGMPLALMLSKIGGRVKPVLSIGFSAQRYLLFASIHASIVSNQSKSQ